MEQYEDKELVCICGAPFVWTVGEQKFLQGLIDDGKTNNDGSPITFVTPKRCASCRVRRRRERAMRDVELS